MIQKWCGSIHSCMRAKQYHIRSRSFQLLKAPQLLIILITSDHDLDFLSASSLRYAVLCMHMTGYTYHVILMIMQTCVCMCAHDVEKEKERKLKGPGLRTGVKLGDTKLLVSWSQASTSTYSTHTERDRGAEKYIRSVAFTNEGRTCACLIWENSYRAKSTGRELESGRVKRRVVAPQVGCHIPHNDNAGDVYNCMTLCMYA